MKGGNQNTCVHKESKKAAIVEEATIIYKTSMPSNPNNLFLFQIYSFPIWLFVVGPS